MVGSSPQARGAQLEHPRQRPSERFIPAGAGNTRGRTAPRSGRAVHPCRRGEHRSGAGRHVLAAGSSPQARGTPTLGSRSRMSGRFIPAGAGNTTRCRDRACPKPVHPRRRGEHACRSCRPFAAAGSSPQARGTRAGSPPGIWPRGSSPQARGTRIVRGLHRGQHRFIPAGAGNTTATLASVRRCPVHPRRRGEHVDLDALLAGRGGSSPQARGTPAPPGCPGTPDRFIPAGAGNTTRRTGSRAGTPVHPRRRGEHRRDRPMALHASGSSPQARGTHPLRRVVAAGHRFIPAGAGNTHPSGCVLRRRPVHPRRRGEHAPALASSPASCGSSPQARGTLQPHTAVFKRSSKMRKSHRPVRSVRCPLALLRGRVKSH